MKFNSKCIFNIQSMNPFDIIVIVFIFVVGVLVGLRNSFDRDYIGFATLPEQVHRKSVKRGFDFTLMVIGGKIHTFHSLFSHTIFQLKTHVNGSLLCCEIYLIRNGAWQINSNKFIVFGRFV